MAKRDCFAAGALVLVVTSGAFAQTAITYQKPSPAIEQLLDAPETPVAHISPDRTLLLIEQPATFPTIADVAQPRFRLAGLRFNPKTSSPSAETWSIGLKLQPIAGGPAKPVAGLPEKLKVTGTLWSPDSKHIAFYQRVDMGTPGLQLWVIDAAAAHAHRVGLVTLNSILGRPCEWMPDNAALLCKTVPTGRGPAPKISDVPTGPNVSERSAPSPPTRT
jgi:hypothetical protein